MRWLTMISVVLVLFMSGCASGPKDPYAHLKYPYVDTSGARGDVDALENLYRHVMGLTAQNYQLDRSTWSGRYEGEVPDFQEAAHLTRFHLEALLEDSSLVDEHFENNRRMHLAVANTFMLQGKWEAAAVGYDDYIQTLIKLEPHLVSVDDKKLAEEHKAWAQEQMELALYQR